MHIINGIANAGTPAKQIEITDVKVLDGMMLIIGFRSGEKRLFDANSLLEYPAFKPLADSNVFSAVKVEYGTLSWNDGEIDIDPATLYAESFPYESKLNA